MEKITGSAAAMSKTLNDDARNILSEAVTVLLERQSDLKERNREKMDKSPAEDKPEKKVTAAEAAAVLIQRFSKDNPTLVGANLRWVLINAAQDSSQLPPELREEFLRQANAIPDIEGQPSDSRTAEEVLEIQPTGLDPSESEGDGWKRDSE